MSSSKCDNGMIESIEATKRYLQSLEPKTKKKEKQKIEFDNWLKRENKKLEKQKFDEMRRMVLFLFHK